MIIYTSFLECLPKYCKALLEPYIHVIILKLSVVISNKHDIFEFVSRVTKRLSLRIIGNLEMLGESQNYIE